MNWRKTIYLPSSEQSATIADEINVIKKRCAELAQVERKEQTENQRSRDSRCPLCRANKMVYDKPNIVDKIASVESKTNIRGNLLKVNGMIVVETKAVNHCNACGHEWEKFRTKTITDFALTKVILDYLSDIIRNSERNKRYSWKHEAIEVFKDCSAEAIHAVQKEYKPSLRHPLTMRQLRTKYNSVFDKKKS